MVKASYDQKPYRRVVHGDVRRERDRLASTDDAGGEEDLGGEAHPESTGSLGIAISEAVEVAATGVAARYALGSACSSHVLLHQSVIGLEAQAQMELADEVPDVVIGCVGGGSNFAGSRTRSWQSGSRGEARMRFLATEPAACPTLTKGYTAYDFGDTSVRWTPLVPDVHARATGSSPPPVHAGGLRYHGDGAVALAPREATGYMEA